MLINWAPVSRPNLLIASPIVRPPTLPVGVERFMEQHLTSLLRWGTSVRREDGQSNGHKMACAATRRKEQSIADRDVLRPGWVSRMMPLPGRLFRALLPVIAFAALAHSSSAQTPGDRFQRVVQPYIDAQMFMGSLLVAKAGKIMFSRSYGMADLEWNIPNSPTTRFNIASLTKQFTAASILLLEDRGKLKTEDSVKKYFPDAPPSWDRITIYHLLTHTSGIADDALKYEPGSPDKLVLNDKPLKFQPGEQWAYTNLGYIVLGYLLERITGQTYENFVQENLFKPLGMNDSGMFSFVTIIPRRAIGYWPGSNGIENADRNFDTRI